MLFDVSDDIDLFGDFDFSETDTNETPPEAQDIDPELVRRSVQEFYDLFSNREDELTIGTGAILLYQHLLAAGYKSTFSADDKSAAVTASTSLSVLKDALIDRVESLLDDMTYMAKEWNDNSFTVHSILTKTDKENLSININFQTV